MLLDCNSHIPGSFAIATGACEVEGPMEMHVLDVQDISIPKTYNISGNDIFSFTQWEKNLDHFSDLVQGGLGKIAPFFQ